MLTIALLNIQMKALNQVCLIVFYSNIQNIDHFSWMLSFKCFFFIWLDEQLLCNVCDKTFKSGSQLSKHQLERKHFCCSLCDAIFPTLISLEIHKKTLSHWTDEEATDDGSSDDDEAASYLRPCKEIEKLL